MWPPVALCGVPGPPPAARQESWGQFPSLCTQHWRRMGLGLCPSPKTCAQLPPRPTPSDIGSKEVFSWVVREHGGEGLRAPRISLGLSVSVSYAEAVPVLVTLPCSRL